VSERVDDKVQRLERTAGVAVSSLRRSGHLVVGSRTLCGLDACDPGWTGIKVGDEWPGLCGGCAARLVELGSERPSMPGRRVLGRSCVSSGGIARGETVLAGLAEPVCPKCGCERPDDVRRRDGDAVELVCPACEHKWTGIVDFVWSELPPERRKGRGRRKA